MAKYLLADGYNLAFRAFYGMPDLTRSDGFPTGALHGWVNTLWMLQDREQPDAFIVFFDSGQPTRHEALLPEYKANRVECPEPLRRQFPVLRPLTAALGMGGIERPGVEADDLLASAAHRLGAAGHEVWVVSADKDLGQLVGGSIGQMTPPPTANPKLGWRRLDAAGVAEKFGVPPRLIPDLLALTGDDSDNIPGLDGVGFKTAAKWLNQYGGLEQVIGHCGELKPLRCQALVHARQADLRRNLLLTTLDRTQEIPSLDKPVADPAALVALLESYEMRALAREARRRHGLTAPADPPPAHGS